MIRQGCEVRVAEPPWAAPATSRRQRCAANEPIDLEKQATWPEASRRWAEERADRLAGSTELLGGLDGRFAEIHYPDPVPGRDVLVIWQPGDPEYDRHTELPR